jgi:hypothetical protein
MGLARVDHSYLLTATRYSMHQITVQFTQGQEISFKCQDFEGMPETYEQMRKELHKK